MKKLIYLIFPILAFLSCEDSNNGDIGEALRSEDDNISTKIDSFFVNTQTIAVPYFYADNSNFIVGKYENEKFGDITGSVLAQVINPSAQEFKKDFVADSITLKIHISKHTGKEATNFEVYQMKGLLDYRTKYYTNISTDEYVDMTKKLGEATLDNQMIELLDTAISKKKSFAMTIPLEKSMAENFLNDLSVYENEKSFLNFFNGFYLKTTGNQQIVTIDSMALCLHYHYPDNDTTAIGTLQFPANNEVRQVNKIENNVNEALANKSQKEEYIFSPASSYTEITIPTRRIVSECIKSNNKDLKYNSALLKIEKNPTEYDKEINAPTQILMIHESDLENYFEHKEMPDGKTSFNASLLKNETSGISYYSFDLTYFLQKKTETVANSGNISDIEESDTFYLIPASFTYNKSGALSMVQNSFNLSALSFKNSLDETSPLSIVVAYSEFFKYK